MYSAGKVTGKRCRNGTVMRLVLFTENLPACMHRKTILMPLKSSRVRRPEVPVCQHGLLRRFCIADSLALIKQQSNKQDKQNRRYHTSFIPVNRIVEKCILRILPGKQCNH